MSLEFERIQKSFGAIKALRGVSFSIVAGESHALVGENGAGKSTLLKILAGLVRADAGEMRWEGKAFSPASPRDAIEHGIGMVYQEMLCFPNLSVAANIFCGREIHRRGILDETAMHERTRTVLGRLQLQIDPSALAESLSTAHRQLLQVARAVAFDCRILVLDEPTTSLTDAEADHLFDVLRELKHAGTTIVYVSHRLPEVFRLCDRITVLRDGGYVATYGRADVTSNDIVKAMVGRELPRRLVHDSTMGGDIDALSISALSKSPHFSDVTLRVGRGEIVGLFGLVGSGRSELLETIFGARRADAGTVKLDGKPIRSIGAAVRGGMGMAPEERK
ncbi:MAG TPA: sugar ABC transporter ATP-binding protein, partial [Vicinamibacterales bacterium]|nr:sugar ABC transporter ATP-binding protein [Vicinamibacterales bacterium]